MVRQSHFSSYLEFKGDLDIFLLDDIDPRDKSEWGRGFAFTYQRKLSCSWNSLASVVYFPRNSFNNKDFKFIGKIKHGFQ